MNKRLLRIAEKYNQQSKDKEQDKKIEQIEEGLGKKNKRETINKAQKIFLLHSLGMLQPLENLGFSKQVQGKILSLLLEEDPDNIRGGAQDWIL